MLEQTEQKRSLKLKSMFRQQLDEQNNTSTLHRKAAAHLQISSPILQHSTSIYSLVSPTRTAFTNIYTSNDGRKDIPFELYQPLSPPPPIPKHKSPYASSQISNSLSPAPQHQRKTNTMRREFERPMHPLDFVPDMPVNKERNPNKGRYADARRTVAIDPREQMTTEDYVKAATSIKNRRHSCSSTAIYKQQQQQQDQTITIKEQQQQQQQKSELARVKSFRSKLRERRRSSKVASSYSTLSSAAATTVASIEQPCMETSKSTPLRKVKTYNVPKKLNTIQDVEKERKMQELEDLISGRRGSTLKLTLTPKGLS